MEIMVYAKIREIEREDVNVVILQIYVCMMK